MTVLATLLAWRPAGVVAVALALLCVVLGMIAGVAVAAARQSDGDTPAEGHPGSAGYELDADTLESLDPQLIGEPGTAGGHGVDADTLDALDPREVRDRRR
ncbi:hypothetical protein ACL02O_15415 [Micromonospora sp. MS34]|uniref:hypothetical protein n=1 Tax=Micromonospora sp. MS34 TaxID=3385971 RepID=UPI0039A21DB2